MPPSLDDVPTQTVDHHPGGSKLSQNQGLLDSGITLSHLVLIYKDRSRLLGRKMSVLCLVSSPASRCRGP